MVFFLNRGLILEHEVIDAIEKYFKLTGVPEYYRNFTVNATNAHPFARMAASLYADTPMTKLSNEALSLFPAVIVTTSHDSKPDALVQDKHWDYICIEPGDIEADSEGISPLERRYDMITKRKISEIRAAMDEREDKKIPGYSMFIRRNDRISIEIWSENPQLNNELYELVRLFVCGFMQDYLAESYKKYFPEIKSGGGGNFAESPLVIFDSTVQGQRSNNYNYDFGVVLYGSQISFDADYIIEQSVIDTELVNGGILLEVINNVKGTEYQTRANVFTD